MLKTQWMWKVNIIITFFSESALWGLIWWLFGDEIICLYGSEPYSFSNALWSIPATSCLCPWAIMFVLTLSACMSRHRSLGQSGKQDFQLAAFRAQLWSGNDCLESQKNTGCLRPWPVSHELRHAKTGLRTIDWLRQVWATFLTEAHLQKIKKQSVCLHYKNDLYLTQSVYRIVFCCLQRLYFIVGVVPKKGLLVPHSPIFILVWQRGKS